MTCNLQQIRKQLADMQMLVDAHVECHKNDRRVDCSKEDIKVIIKETKDAVLKNVIKAMGYDVFGVRQTNLIINAIKDTE